MSSHEPGWVVWITGLAGSGKTTISREVDRVLRERTRAVVRLDGDDIRSLMGNNLGYEMNDRLENAKRICRLANHLSQQGIHVVVATISLFKECHDWNRTHMPRYLEVLVTASRETLRVRNQKGLYGSPGDEAAANVVGIDQSYDLPADPHLVIDNEEGGSSASSAAQQIIALLNDL